MRHLVKDKKLGRNSSQRKALLRSLVTSFLEKERIKTTLAKAKATRPLAEKMITLAKKNTLHTRRRALSFLYKKSVVKKLFEDMLLNGCKLFRNVDGENFKEESINVFI